MAFPITLDEHRAIEAKIDALPELVVAAAVRTPLGTLTRERPARHSDLWALLPSGMKSNDEDVVHGFMTSRGRFVDRREAARIVVETAQGSPRTYDGYTPALFSEDMWLDLFELPPPDHDAIPSAEGGSGKDMREAIMTIIREQTRVDYKGKLDPSSPEDIADQILALLQSPRGEA